jgi:hypothetical protein
MSACRLGFFCPLRAVCVICMSLRSIRCLVTPPRCFCCIVNWLKWIRQLVLLILAIGRNESYRGPKSMGLLCQTYALRRKYDHCRSKVYRVYLVYLVQHDMHHNRNTTLEKYIYLDFHCLRIVIHLTQQILSLQQLNYLAQGFDSSPENFNKISPSEQQSFSQNGLRLSSLHRIPGR